MIKIKKENKGKFTNYAIAHDMSVQQAAHSVLAHPNNSLLKKRAQFAINASHFNHRMDNGGSAETDSLIGSGLGLAAGMLIPGAQPFIPELMTLGSKAGSAYYNHQHPPTPVDQQNTQSSIQPMQPYQGFKQFGYGFANGGTPSIPPQMLQQLMQQQQQSQQQQPQQVQQSQQIPQGTVRHPIVNAEHKELVTNQGAIKRDLISLPPHPTQGINPQGNIQVQKGDTIIPKYMRKSYINSSIDKRKEMEKKLVREQKQRLVSNGKMDSGGSATPFSDDVQGYNSYINQQQLANQQQPIGNPFNNYVNYPVTQPTQAQGLDNIQRLSNTQAQVNNQNYTPLYPDIADTKSNNLGTTLGYAAPYLDNAVNAYLIAKTPKLPNPIMNQNIHLSKRYNVDPQFAQIAAEKQTALADIANKTNSGSIYRGAAADIYGKTLANKNQVYSNLYNYQQGTTNQERQMNNQINNSNVALLNDYNLRNTMRTADIQSRISQNVKDVSEDLQNQIHDNKLSYADAQKIGMIYQIYNKDGELNRAGLVNYLASDKTLTPGVQNYLYNLLQKSPNN